MTPEEKYELFEKYCNHELSSEERLMLDRIIKEDEAVEKELKLYQELHVHLDVGFTGEEEKNELENTLKKIGDSYFSNKSIKQESKIIKMPVWLYAVAASIAIVFGVYFFNQGDPAYSDYANIPELAIAQRSSAQEEVKKAENAFNAKKYAEAEKYLSVLISQDVNNIEYQFYYGISLLEQDKYKKTTKVFQKISQGNSIYNHKAIWFEALNQLKQGKHGECSELLKTIPESAEDYEIAQELLKKLD
ncbi:hypothetical protein [Aquimarina sp. AU474]|uniref:hypothetical protein n=1 Tax=Aquimarina sp. AU474 TaxID=2108529 RepID=UPI000D6A04DD|nr:hypothetical protein [Aquimarina sp. AU474]